MNMSVPIENSEIPQTGLESSESEVTGISDTRRKEEFEMMIKTEVKGVEMKYDKVQHAIIARWDDARYGDYYNFQFFTNALNPESSMLKEGIVNVCSAEMEGLPSGQRVFVRVRIISLLGLGPRSKTVEKRVP